MTEQVLYGVYVAIKPTEEPGWQIDYVTAERPFAGLGDFDSSDCDSSDCDSFKDKYPLATEFRILSENIVKKAGEHPVPEKCLHPYKTLEQRPMGWMELDKLRETPCWFLAPEAVPADIVAAGWRHDDGADCWVPPETPVGDYERNARMTIDEAMFDSWPGWWKWCLSFEPVDPAFCVGLWKKFYYANWSCVDDPDIQMSGLLKDIREGKDAYIAMDEEARGWTTISVRPRDEQTVHFTVESLDRTFDERYDFVLLTTNVLEEFEEQYDWFVDIGGWKHL
jgi:hypothetical protein